MEAAEIADSRAIGRPRRLGRFPPLPQPYYEWNGENRINLERDGRRFPAISQTAGSINQIQLHKEPDTSLLGWSLGSQRGLSLTLSALNRALPGRRLKPGLIFHSDRGVEYSAYAFRARLAALGITQSMKRPRELTDNAFIESFFHSMKSDVIHGRTFDDPHALHRTISHYLRRYNRTRLHSSLGYRSPIDYENAAA